jgi:hypothetical protein
MAVRRALRGLVADGVVADLGWRDGERRFGLHDRFRHPASKNRSGSGRQAKQREHLLMCVSACVALLAKEARAITPAAIAAIVNQFPENEIATALAELQTSGAYADNVARGVAMRAAPVH